MKQGELVFLPSDAPAKRALGKAERALLSWEREDMPPAGQALMDHMQFLKDHFLRPWYRFRFFRRLPRGDRDARILEAARECVWTDTDVLKCETVLKTLLKWEKERPWTLRETDFLQTSLCMALMEKAAGVAADCASDMASYRQAGICFRRMRAGRRPHIPDDKCCVERLWRLSREAEDERALLLVDEEMEKRYGDGEKLRRQMRENRILKGERMRRIVQSLKALDSMDLDAVKEKVLPVFAVLDGDETFSRMDRDSRWQYARRCDRLGREYGTDEAQIASYAVSLAMDGEGVKGHAGWYLSEGMDAIARQTGKWKSGAALIRGEKRYTLALLGVTGLFGIFLLLFQVRRYVLPLALPVFFALVRMLTEPVMDKLHLLPLLPRLAPAKDDEPCRILLTVPSVIRGRQHMLRMARRLLVFRENCGEDTDLMLLGTFKEKQTEDWQEEIAAAFDMMNGQEGRKRYFYLLDHAAAGREENLKASWVSRLCAWIRGDEAEEAFPIGNTTVEELKERYDYVITLDENVLLPHDAVEKWVCMMRHPLQKGRVSVIVPQMKVWRMDRGMSMKTQNPFGHGVYEGIGILDPYLYHENGILRVSRDICLVRREKGGLTEELQGVLRQARRAFSPLSGFPMGESKGWRVRQMGNALLSAARLGLMLLSACGQAPLAALLALPWPLKGLPERLALLPGHALCGVMGAVRPRSDRDLKEWMFSQPLSVLLMSLACGVGTVILALGEGGFVPMVLPGFVWLCAPIRGLMQERSAPSFSERDAEDMRRMARDTWHFFDTFVTEESHFLPPHEVRIGTQHGVCTYTTPSDAGVYLLSTLAAREMGLITGQEMGRRLNGALDAMEKWPMENGVPYCRYDLDTLQPVDQKVLPGDTGIFCMALLCASQGARSHIRETDDAHRQISARLDVLFERVRLDTLYDRRVDRFYRSVDKGKPSRGHFDLLCGESLLLSFAAVVKGQIPSAHFDHLEKTFVRSGGGAALLSRYGGMSEYLLARLMLPYFPGTALNESSVHAVRAQMAVAPVWGVSECACAETDAQLCYVHRPFGIRHLARRPAEENVIAPYASALALACAPGSALANLRRMRLRHWVSEFGFQEAADFRPARVEKTPRLVNMHTALHQGVILCALANALCRDVLVRHCCRVPRVESALPLLMTPVPRHVPMRREAKQPRRTPRPERSMVRAAGAAGGMDGWICGFHGSCMAINARGQGRIATGDRVWNRFSGAWDGDEGFRLYIYDRASGAHVRPALEKGELRTGFVRFRAETDGLEITEQRTMAPLTGAHLMWVTVKNKKHEARDVDVVSFLMLDSAWESSVERADDRVLIANGQGACLGHYAVGNCARLDAQGDAVLFLGPNGQDAPAFVTDENPCMQTGRVMQPCVSFRMRLAIGPGEEKNCAFVTCVRETEEDLREILSGYTDIRKIRGAFSLSRSAVQMHLRSLHMDADRQALYGRLLGACLFCLQPHQVQTPTVPSAELERYGVTGDVPIVTLLLQEGEDHVLLHHLLRFHEWLRTQGLWVDLCVVCPRETGEEKRALDSVRHAVLALGAGRYLEQQGGIHLLPLRPGEERALCMMSRVVLRGGQTLLSQLDALNRKKETEKSSPAVLPQTVSVPELDRDHGYGGFTEEGAYHIYRHPPVPLRYLLCEREICTRLCDRGVMETWHESRIKGSITGGAGNWGTAEEMVLITAEGTCMLTMGNVELDAGYAVYHAQFDMLEGQMEVFVHPVLPLSFRRVTLRARESVQGTLRFRVRFSMGEKEEYTRLYLRGASAAAVHGDCMGAGYVMTDAAGVTPDIAKAPWAVMEVPFALEERESTKVEFALGYAEDLLKVPLKWDLDAGSVLRDVKKLWQTRLNGLTIYTMHGHVDRMLTRWLPVKCYGALMQKEKSPYAALQEALGLVYTCPSALRALFLHCAEMPYGEAWEEEWQIPVTADRYARVTGENIFRQGEHSLLSWCIASLESIETGTSGLPLDQGRESARLGFLWVRGAKTLAPWCDENTAAVLLARAKDMIRQLECAWTGEWYTDVPGDDASPDVALQCMAALAGAPVRAARRATGTAWTLTYDEEKGCLREEARQQISTGDMLLLVEALCCMEEDEKAWALFYALPPFTTYGLNTPDIGMVTSRQAGQMLHAFLYCLLRFDVRGSRAQLFPRSGMGEKEVTLLYRYGESTYHLTADTHTSLVTLDGKRQDEKYIPLSPEKGTHEARFPIWKV